MKIACPSCAAKYSIADDKVINRLAKIRCRKCSTTIVIDGKANPPTVQAAGVSSVHPGAAAVSHAPTASALPQGSSFTVDLGEHDQRTMTVAELVEAYNSGTVTADTYVWQDGMADWAPLAEVAEINDALHAAAGQGAAEPAPAAPAYVAQAQPAQASEYTDSAFADPGLGGLGLGGLGGAASAAREPVRAATRADARADLFGGIDTAGGERSGAGGQTNVTVAATGARNESSVLFSLSALTAEEKPRAPVSAGAPLRSANTDDSGLIDLAALAAAAETSHAAQSTDLGPAPLALGGPFGAGNPFGAAPLTGGTTAPLGVEAQGRASGRGGLYIGGGIAVAAIVAGLVYLLKEEPPQVAIPAPPTTVIVTQIATAPAAPTVASAASAEPSSSAEKDDKAPPKRRTAPPKRTTQPKDNATSSKGSDDSSGAIKTEPKPKPKSKCNCAPSDLLCAMKCSTK